MRAISVATAVLLCLPALSPAQQRLTWYEKRLLVPASRSVSGVVVDPSGKPIVDAHIDHSDVTQDEQLFTDAQGRFHFQTRAPAMVVRKHGFDGQIFRTAGDRPLRIVLQPSARSIPPCTKTCDTLKGPGHAFCFPVLPGFRASQQGSYIDSIMRVFTLLTKDGEREILLGSGPTWSLGIPYTGDVWESTDYSERAYQLGDSDVVDARGTMRSGKRWRYLGTWGESASYYEADEKSAVLLDRFLDGVCAAGDKSTGEK